MIKPLTFRIANWSSKCFNLGCQQHRPYLRHFLETFTMMTFLNIKKDNTYFMQTPHGKFDLKIIEWIYHMNPNSWHHHHKAMYEFVFRYIILQIKATHECFYGNNFSHGNVVWNVFWYLHNHDNYSLSNVKHMNRDII